MQGKRRGYGRLSLHSICSQLRPATKVVGRWNPGKSFPRLRETPLETKAFKDSIIIVHIIIQLSQPLSMINVSFDALATNSWRFFINNLNSRTVQQTMLIKSSMTGLSGLT